VSPVAPDVLAYPLEEAEALLAAAGYTVAVEETRPPRGEPQGGWRVVRQRQEGDRVRLVVTAERHLGPAAPADR
jgi:hypothetical protein